MQGNSDAGPSREGWHTVYVFLVLAYLVSIPTIDSYSGMCTDIALAPRVYRSRTMITLR